MSTIHHAVQAMVDNLTTKMTSGTPFTPEEQLLVSKAISALKDNETWEKAVVAVVEEHLDTATTSLTSATAAINTSTGVINAQASNLAMIPQMRDDVTKSVANVVPLVKQAVDSGSAIPSRVGASVLGTITTSSLYKPSSFRCKQTDSGEALCIPYYDEKARKLYHAFITLNSVPNNINYYHLNINFGYWQGEVFTSLYKYNESSSNSNGIFSESNDRQKMDATYAVIVPLAKFENPEDVRVCLVLASSTKSTDDSGKSFRAVISVNPDEKGVVVYTGASSTACDEGATTSNHPLCGNGTQLAYDKFNKRIVGFNGALQYYNRAVGISTLCKESEENLTSGSAPTFGYHAAELSKKEKYISFTGYLQSGQPIKGRFVRCSDHLQKSVLEAYSIPEKSGYHSSPYWTNLSNSSYKPVSDDSYMYGYSQFSLQNAYTLSMNTNSMSDKAFSYLVKKADEDIVPYQIFYGHCFRHYAFTSGSSIYSCMDVNAVNYCVLDEEGHTLSHGTLPLPELHRARSITDIKGAYDLVLIPIAFDTKESKLHFIRGCFEAFESGSKAHMSTLIYKV